MNVAIITAGGVGTRMKMSTPKQFYQVNGKPLILYTLEAFQNSKHIDAITVVYLEGYFDFFMKMIKKYNLTKIKWLTPGGSTNQMSIFNGLKKIENEISPDDIIIVHDGIRPLITDDVIEDSIKVCELYGNAVAVVPSNEAMLQSFDGMQSNMSIDRNTVWKTQTPHSMKFRDMLMLLNNTINKGIYNSVAVCTMLIENNFVVHFSKGNNNNFKITQPEDLILFEAYLQSIKKDN